MTKAYLIVSVAAAAIAASLGSPALAQDAPAAPLEAERPVQDPEQSGQLQDIVVTAQKRSENLQKVPVAVAVASAELLQTSGITSLQNLKIATPGVQVGSIVGYAVPTIRGVGQKIQGAGVESAVATYVDGVYYANTNSTLLSFNNIAQIEVLKGPQGTLFGRNATGGLIQVTTRDPKHSFEGEGSVSYGNYQTLKGVFYLTGGLTDNIATDLAFAGTTMGTGYGTNLFTGKQSSARTKHDIALRSKTLATLGDRTEVRLIFDYNDLLTSAFDTRVPAGISPPPAFGSGYGGGPWDVNQDEPTRIKMSGGGTSLRVDHDLGGVSIASITAYRQTKYHNRYDFDYTPVRGRIADILQKDSQFSQELQLLSESGGRLSYVLGAYYFRARSRYPFVDVFFLGPQQFPTTPPTYLVTTKSYVDTDSLAGYGQATYELTDKLNFTAGLRYTSEKRKLGDASVVQTRVGGTTFVTFPQQSSSKRFNKLTWRLAVDYDLSDTVLAYASYNRGFKSGGFNPSSPTIPPYDPEVLDAYEVGLKTTLFDRRVRFNTSAFYYDYKDVQISRNAATGTGIYNSASEEVYGAEAEIDAQITRELNLRVSYQYLHGRYTAFPNALFNRVTPAGYAIVGTGDATGNTTTLSPKSTLSVTGNYTVPVGDGDVKFNVSYYYNSGFFHEPDNFVKQSAYSLINASVRWRHSEDGLWVSLWANNLTNKAVAFLDGFSAAGTRRAGYEPPRTYGVTVGTKF